jgi:GTP diphosphokinase / guanosine-3',5'-bis(diphosphate) 3'-diphosphatase
VPGRIKDFIAMPRPNGYQSLHTSVISEHGFPFEVQIRTEEMHRRAEEGIAAHWKYKEGRVGAGRDEQYFQWLRQLLEWQQEVRDPQEFLTNLKIDLYPEEVYTFTPRGQVKVLPRGRRRSISPTPSTPTSDTSASAPASTAGWCRSAPSSRTATSSRSSRPGHKPSRDWLSFVVTSRARNKIKHLIQVGGEERAVELGRKLFEKEGRRFDLNLPSCWTATALRAAPPSSACRKDDLFAQIGYGKVSPGSCSTSSCRRTAQGEGPEHPVLTA